MSDAVNKWKLLAIIIFMIKINLIEYLISPYLLEISLDTIKYLQSMPFLKWICKYIIFLGSNSIKYYLLIIIFTFCNHYHTMLYSIVLYSSLFYASFLKILFQEMRPYWVDNSIFIFKCDSSYSLPSNHIQTTIPVFLIFWDIMYYRFELEKDVHLNMLNHRIGVIIINIFIFLQSFAQIFSGAQTIDQSIFAILIGFSIYFLFTNIFNYSVDDYQPLLDLLLNISKVNSYLLTFFLIYFVYLIFLLTNNEEIDSMYISFIPDICRENLIFTPYQISFIGSADYFGLLGCISGILLDRIIYNTAYKQSKSLLYIAENLNVDNSSRIGNWNNTSICLSITRFIIILMEVLFIKFAFNHLILSYSYSLAFYYLNKALLSFFKTFLLFNIIKSSTIWLKVSNLNLTDESGPNYIRKSSKSLITN